MRSTFCLESVSSANQISYSPLNTSKTKQLYSFSKDSRFKRPTIYCDHIYNTPQAFSQSVTSFPRKTITRSGSKDLNRSHMNSTSNSKKRLSFNPSRSVPSEYIQKLSHHDYSYLSGPDMPSYDHIQLKRTPKFSMRKKLKVIDKTMSIQSQNDNPGAGRYQNPEALSPRGVYTVSKHKNTSMTKFDPTSSKRFFGFKNMNPGPGKYNIVNKLSDSGHYVLTQTQGFGQRLFDKERRVVQFQSKAKNNYNPGPGSYRSPSDFGHYDGQVYGQTGGISYITTNNFYRKPSRTRF